MCLAYKKKRKKERKRKVMCLIFIFETIYFGYLKMRERNPSDSMQLVEDKVKYPKHNQHFYSSLSLIDQTI